VKEHGNGRGNPEIEVTDQIVTDCVMNELMGKDPSARFRFIVERAEEAQEFDV
jgi:DNA gyrase subunit B